MMISFSRRMSAIVLASSLGVWLAAPSPGVAQDSKTKSIEALAAETASTPAQHLALAAHFREKAEAARAEVELHRTMALSYSSHSAGASAGMKSHCDRLSEAARTEATEYDALAAFHEAQAKK